MKKALVSLLQETRACEQFIDSLTAPKILSKQLVHLSEASLPLKEHKDYELQRKAVTWY
jgi:hypothetical protein